MWPDGKEVGVIFSHPCSHNNNNNMSLLHVSYVDIHTWPGLQTSTSSFRNIPRFAEWLRMRPASREADNSNVLMSSTYSTLIENEPSGCVASNYCCV